MTRAELFEHIKKKQSYLCVGLDTDIKKIPKHLLHLDDPVVEFNRQIIDATKEFAVAYKPNLAFYESLGPNGLHSLHETIRHIPKDIFTIADAKRGDIGNTSTMYAKTFYEYYGFDSVTVAPYMGRDSVSPFLEHPNKFAIVLALTSNEGSKDFQVLQTNKEANDKNRMQLYEAVLSEVSAWGTPDNLMFVIGATHPEMMAGIREIVPEHFLLIPGVGAQGGSLEEISKHGMNASCGLLVNSSRQIIYASSGEDFAEKARAEAMKVQSVMKELLGQFFS